MDSVESHYVIPMFPRIRESVSSTTSLPKGLACVPESSATGEEAGQLVGRYWLVITEQQILVSWLHHGSEKDLSLCVNS